MLFLYNIYILFLKLQAASVYIFQKNALHVYFFQAFRVSPNHFIYIIKLFSYIYILIKCPWKKFLIFFSLCFLRDTLGLSQNFLAHSVQTFGRLLGTYIRLSCFILQIFQQQLKPMGTLRVTQAKIIRFFSSKKSKFLFFKIHF